MSDQRRKGAAEAGQAGEGRPEDVGGLVLSMAEGGMVVVGREGKKKGKKVRIRTLRSRFGRGPGGRVRGGDRETDSPISTRVQTARKPC